MLKMFSTQLSGLFKKIMEREENSIEDGARLLAQAALGEGTIFIGGIGEMRAIATEAIYGAEPLQGAKRLAVQEASSVEDGSIKDLASADRVLLAARESNDEAALFMAKELVQEGVPFVAIFAIARDGGIQDLADVSISLDMQKGLLPDEEGGRFGYPVGIAALFVYHGLKFAIDEMIAEYEE
ncbi:DUF2529 family protein [Bacillus massilinigeriensis]|uniref:DUF2529 family protein n=1 Tax=Bacillus mediterraneensis TaxID=1805474 RepID=UPI0008F8E2E8|nr:DUF2529 family protein [Bacillus mediterraneensis]